MMATQTSKPSKKDKPATAPPPALPLTGNQTNWSQVFAKRTLRSFLSHPCEPNPYEPNMLLATWFSSEEDVGVQVNLMARPFEQESKRLIENRYYKRIELAVVKDEQEEETRRMVELTERILVTWAGYGPDLHEEVTVLAAQGHLGTFMQRK